jgi:hypothetical protein
LLDLSYCYHVNPGDFSPKTVLPHKPSSYLQREVYGAGTDKSIAVALPHITAKWLTLLLRIQEVTDSNLSPETGYPD